MSSTPLDKPAELYRPFPKGESDVLRGFVESVEELKKMRFFGQVPKTASQTLGGPNAGTDMSEPDTQDLRAAIMELRQLYDGSEPYSFRRAMNVLKRSVNDRNSLLRDAGLADLKALVRAEKEAIDVGIGIGIVFDHGSHQEDVDVEKIIDTYFHGKWVHRGNAKSELARRLDNLGPWGRFTLYTVMLRLRNVYVMAGNAAARVLGEPHLLDARPIPTS